MLGRAGTVPVLVIALAVAACAAQEPPPPQTVQGECADVFGGQVCSWADLDGAGAVTAFGVTVPMRVVDSAPAEMVMAWPPVANATLRMPAQVTETLGVDHFTFFWEAHGHPPGAFLTPHFDFHFYNIATAAREAMDCTDTSKPATLTPGYILPDEEIPGLGLLVGLCVPAMGMHSGPADEFARTDLFDGTMIVGYYQGAPIFFEPMIAKHHLARRQSFDVAMPVVPGVPAGVRYPARFRAEYDAATDAYQFRFAVN